jgi:hypothetical protein
VDTGKDPQVLRDLFTKDTKKKLLCRNPFFQEIFAPLAPALPPLGAGAHAMPWNYREKNSPEFTYW